MYNLFDNDFYKFKMLAIVKKLYPNAIATYEFICRDPQQNLSLHKIKDVLIDWVNQHMTSSKYIDFVNTEKGQEFIKKTFGNQSDLPNYIFNPINCVGGYYIPSQFFTRDHITIERSKQYGL